MLLKMSYIVAYELVCNGLRKSPWLCWSFFISYMAQAQRGTLYHLPDQNWSYIMSEIWYFIISLFSSNYISALPPVGNMASFLLGKYIAEILSHCLFACSCQEAVFMLHTNKNKKCPHLHVILTHSLALWGQTCSCRLCVTLLIFLQNGCEFESFHCCCFP